MGIIGSWLKILPRNGFDQECFAFYNVKENDKFYLSIKFESKILKNNDAKALLHVWWSGNHPSTCRL